jgi:hypothetical protein
MFPGTRFPQEDLAEAELAAFLARIGYTGDL